MSRRDLGAIHPLAKTVLDGKHPGDKVNVRWTDQMGTTQAAKVTLTDGPTG